MNTTVKRQEKIANLLQTSCVMGILNLSSDSFSGDGSSDSESIKKRVLEMIKEGVHFIDVGAQSTRPGATQVPSATEEKSVKEAVELIRALSEDVVISVDTTRVSVARMAINSGADIINDISGGQFDEEMFEVLKQHPHIFYVIGHTEGTFQTMHTSYVYQDVVDEILIYAKKQLLTLESFGIASNRVIVDPCIGFSKNKEQNIYILRHIERLAQGLPVPMLIGLSRKGFIKKYTNVEDNDSLDRYTLTLNSILLGKGVKVIRTHEVHHTMKMLQLLNQIYEH